MRPATIFSRLAVLSLITIGLLFLRGAHVPGTQAASAALLPQQPLDFGDAPEGSAALAYPPAATLGQFPTCLNVGPALFIGHTNFGAFFGPLVDLEPDGNAGFCQTAPCFPPYDKDECFNDGDAGLIVPEPFTIDGAKNIVPCPQSAGTALGYTCQTAFWGANVDIQVTNNMPGNTTGFVNVLMDWNQDGQWGGSATCPGNPAVQVPEHVLVNFPVPHGFVGRLSRLFPPNFLIGP